MKPCTEKVLGSELREGDLIWQEGFLWRIADEPRHEPESPRWYLTLVPSGFGPDPDYLGAPFNRQWNSALRDDLPWLRQIRPGIDDQPTTWR